MVRAAACIALVLAGALGCAKGKSTADLPAGAVPVDGSERAAPPALPAAPVNAAPVAAGLAAPLSFAPIAKRADASVVTISTISEEIEAPQGIFSRGHGRRRETKGLGTGFVVDKDGVILTNNHVVEGAAAITVQLSSERSYPARIVGRDPRTDVAVVKIDTKDKDVLTPLAMGDSDALDVGDWVVAIGNPFGLSHTVSAGIVSAKGRGKEDVPLDPSGYYNFLQTDASINPGNSGGPLLNLKGEVVGMNTAIRGGGAQGIGFAIPINMVKQLLPTLLRDGHITRSALGIRIRDVRDLAPEDKAAFKIDGDRGAVVEYVEPGGAADKAGLAPGDIIVGFDGQAIERGSLLQWLASTTGVGKSATVRVMRGGKAFDTKVVLGQLPEPRAMPHPARAPAEPQEPGPGN